MNTSETMPGPAPAGGNAVRSLARSRGSPGEPHVDSNSNQVRRPPFAWRTRVALPAVLLLGVAGVLAYTARDVLIPPTPVKVIPVLLAPAGNGGGAAQAGSVTVQAPGWVEPDPFPISVPALTDGIVREVLVLEGEPVKEGQVVARFVDDEARLALLKAEAELALREATVQAAQANWDHPVERTRAVAAAGARVEQAQAEQRMLESEIEAAVAKSAELRYESEQLNKAFEKQAATALEVIVARQRSIAADATQEATRRRVAVLRQQFAMAEADWTAAKENQRLRIEEARALAEAKAAADLARAARDEAKLRLDRMEIRSAADGVVLSRLIEPGSKMMLAMDHPLSSVAVKLYDPARLQVRVDVPLADAAKVSVGQEAQVTVAKLPDRVFRGKVTRIVREADVQKNTQQFKVKILDPAPELTPEMLARAKFLSTVAVDPTGPTGAGATSVFAPTSLLQRQGDSAEATTWVVDPAGRTAVRKTIQLGTATRGGWIAVRSGLMPGDQLIADPSGLTPGQRIRTDGEAPIPESPDPIIPQPQTKEASHGVH